MVRPIFGTAHLYGLVPAATSDELLSGALDAGFGWLDTAPSYGFGRSEVAVGALPGGVRSAVGVTTKVGIAPGEPPSNAKRWAKAAARRLPSSVQDKLRGSGAPGHGQFAASDVRASIETSLRRLGHIDRLLLHEVRPADITEELVEVLTHYVDRVDQFGVATANDQTVASIARAPELLTCTHYAVGPLFAPLALPDTVTTRVGHGLLGNGGDQLRALQQQLSGDSALADRWRAAVAGTRWAGQKGLADALVARSLSLDLTDAIVATSQPAKQHSLLQLLTGDPVELAVLGVIAEVAAAASAG